ncbi:tRNA (guanine(26)-n(2))-dimethyltransferase [Anaeramoeba flamelloides]|uniref:tRNA (guanine(26)-N(2))-dimethyltransferase n=1 Tax=Anaeramoeba flamelloides TaxID=1746091 RepID=A0ABQ8XQ83_9EUKA|nr:tRNA (guanine(26)-n(2))-dimethyltransferase [Anaeramoeba flamelloides]
MSNQTKEKLNKKQETKTTKEKEKEKEKQDKQFIQEGLALISNPKDNSVFYNPVQIINRDMSTLVIQTYAQLITQELTEIGKKKKNKIPSIQYRKDRKPISFQIEEEATKRIKNRSFEEFKGLKILEALSASGLRSIRYFKEIDGVSKILANDLSETAYESIQQNVKLNQLNPESEVIPTHSDAIDLMMKHRQLELQFDVIDLDPYGSPSIFLEPTIQCIKSGGLLCVTCTDMTVLCGSNPTNVHTKYGALPIKKYYCHEFALRLVLGTLEKTANKFKKYIVPVLSLSMDFYIRMFVRVFEGPGEARKGASKLSHVFQSTISNQFQFISLVDTKYDSQNKNKNNQNPDLFRPNTISNTNLFDPNFKQSWKIAGPIWNQPIHDQNFVEKAIDFLTQNKQELSFSTHKRMLGILKMAKSELPDSPLYYSLQDLNATFKGSCLPLKKLKSALVNAGYKQSGTHCLKNAIKTNAPIDYIYQIYYAWFEQNGEKEQVTKKLKINHPYLLHLFSQFSELEPNQIKIDFTPPKDVKNESSIKAFFPNPEKHWGPKKRASGKSAVKENPQNTDKKQKN